MAFAHHQAKNMFVLPFSQACENNKQPILNILQSIFASCKSILEIGSGTGQHAIFFAEKMPWLTWQPSDQKTYLMGIAHQRENSALTNLLAPIELNVSTQPWPSLETIDGIFSANTCHIMSWAMVEDFIAGVGKTLISDGIFCLYGPFNYQGKFTSESNAQFDAWLKQRDNLSGIRDYEAMLVLAEKNGLQQQADHSMPANNRLLVFKKI
jgi:SAM-dependent methyltransferase